MKIESCIRALDTAKCNLDCARRLVVQAVTQFAIAKGTPDELQAWADLLDMLEVERIAKRKFNNLMHENNDWVINARADDGSPEIAVHDTAVYEINF